MSDDTTRIRRLGPVDGPLYRAVRLEALQTAPDAFGSTYAAECERPASHFTERVTNSAVYVAERAGEPVGMIGFRREGGLKDQHRAFVWGFYVAPRARRRGVGRALLARVIDDAAAQVEQLSLAVVADNQAALDLYRQAGFVQYGHQPRALKAGERYFDEILMLRML